MSDAIDAGTEDADWEVTRERQLLAWASATPDQRLAWSTGALPRPRPAYERWTGAGVSK